MARAPITCHVLDTKTGSPAAGIRVRLIGDDKTTYRATTNDDGRVESWEGAGHDHPRSAVLQLTNEPTKWTLEFETEEYFAANGQESFFPYVSVHFRTDSSRRHYHVPLLLSPYSYTTYRGS